MKRMATGLFVAAAVGASRVRAVERTVVRVAIAGALTWALGFALFGGLDTHDFGTDLSAAERARLERALDRIGEGEPVAAAPLLIAHVSRRGEVYSLPEPFLQLDWGSPLTRADLAQRAERVRFAAFQGTSKPFEFEGDMGAVYERLRANGFEVVARPEVREVVVLERRPRLRK
jgi:hypothetical protein